MRLTILCLVVSSCGAPASGPAATPVVAKIEIESAPAEEPGSAPSSPEPDGAGGADTDTVTDRRGEPLVVEDEGGAEAKASAAPVPKIRSGKVVVSGGLPQEVVMRIVRQGYGRVRMCYEKGLERDPSVQGTVNASFVIESDGSVSHPRDSGSSVSDPILVKCVVSTFYGCSFPNPENGNAVSVDYSLTLSPH